MQLTGLRIVGFKTFVEPTEVAIRPGLSGVVGPNGCGKSNLVEALRWVMGESSHKNMRASGMDDVIFSGAGSRPARNSAEVTLTVDNESRTAPAQFNDHDRLDISRRIEREQGSTYRVNGREVRARDVQLLFADAATGARSPALVRQGQIAELIGAKPQARRRILEDAAGIAGLHSRRHEAELRLRAAEENLLRVEDVLRAIDGQADALRRQGRQAARYRALSADIRAGEATVAALAFRLASDEADGADAQARADLGAVAYATAAQGEAATRQAVAAHAIGALREGERAAAAALGRLVGQRHDLDGEEKRARERGAGLARRIAELGRDIARGGSVAADAEASLARARREAEALGTERDDEGPRRGALEEARQEADTRLAEAEAVLLAVGSALAARRAERAAADAARRTEADRLARLGREAAGIAAEAARLEGSGARGAAEAARAAVAQAEEAAAGADADAAAARDAFPRLREADAGARAALAERERVAGRLETEHRTLAALFARPGDSRPGDSRPDDSRRGGAKAGGSPASGRRWPPLIDTVQVEPGFEAALGAALGDDLEAASTDGAAPVRWHDPGPACDDPPLPDGCPSLAAHVTGLPVLARRLAQIGLVTREEGARSQPFLRPGQRLVSRDGDLWRWDGYVAGADAPSPAARRLAEGNRLAALDAQAAAARRDAEAVRAGAAEADAALRSAIAREGTAIDAARRVRRLADEARGRAAAAERADAGDESRRGALAEARERLRRDTAETEARLAAADAALQALDAGPDLAARDTAARAGAADARRTAAAAGAALAGHLARADADARRRQALADEIRLWGERAAAAASSGRELGERLLAAEAEKAELDAAPDAFVLRRRGLSAAIAEAEQARRAAADRLAAAETDLAAADRAARTTLDALGAARERRAVSQTRAEGLAARRADLARGLADTFGLAPAALLAQAGLSGDAQLPDGAATESRLAALKAERERLGAVNLRAEEELAETEGRSHALAGERDDLTEAIRRLRAAIGSLNREGRERLLAAFATVNGHFGRLFTVLFGGGEAAIALVESDDPLEAGLEITARPPGKRPQVLSLLSGGEQALTAAALIFAVFLTNPSPICVLDEVDAPLDDANVERYCDLLRTMVDETATRFMVITHNPITMARMDRLFGVTMTERGVSQLVSVDLQDAERLREAG